MVQTKCKMLTESGDMSFEMVSISIFFFFFLSFYSGLRF